MALYIGVDIGTSGTKSLIMDETGTILAESTAEYPIQMPKPLWTEQDPEDWWQAVKKTIKAVVKTSKAKKSDIKAIGLSGQMHGSVFLNKKGGRDSARVALERSTHRGGMRRNNNEGRRS